MVCDKMVTIFKEFKSHPKGQLCIGKDWDIMNLKENERVIIYKLRLQSAKKMKKELENRKLLFIVPQKGTRRLQAISQASEFSLFRAYKQELCIIGLEL